MGIPQLLMVGFLGVELGMVAIRFRYSPHLIAAACADVAIGVGLLIWGGFFN